MSMGGSGLLSTANETPLNSDQQPLFPGFKSARDAAGLPQELLGDGNRRFLVLEVDTIAGNDPFDEQQPFLNFNGQRFSSVVALLAVVNDLPIVDGNPVVDPPDVTPPPDGSFTCRRSSVESLNGGASIEIISNTSCTLFRGFVGNAVNFNLIPELAPPYPFPPTLAVSSKF